MKLTVHMKTCQCRMAAAAAAVRTHQAAAVVRTHQAVAVGRVQQAVAVGRTQQAAQRQLQDRKQFFLKQQTAGHCSVPDCTCCTLLGG